MAVEAHHSSAPMVEVRYNPAASSSLVQGRMHLHMLSAVIWSPFPYLPTPAIASPVAMILA